MIINGSFRDALRLQILGILKFRCVFSSFLILQCASKKTGEVTKWLISASNLIKFMGLLRILIVNKKKNRKIRLDSRKIDVSFFFYAIVLRKWPDVLDMALVHANLFFSNNTVLLWHLCWLQVCSVSLFIPQWVYTFENCGCVTTDMNNKKTPHMITPP